MEDMDGLLVLASNSAFCDMIFEAYGCPVTFCCTDVVAVLIYPRGTLGTLDRSVPQRLLNPNPI